MGGGAGGSPDLLELVVVLVLLLGLAHEVLVRIHGGRADGGVHPLRAGCLSQSRSPAVCARADAKGAFQTLSWHIWGAEGVGGSGRGGGNHRELLLGGVLPLDLSKPVHLALLDQLGAAGRVRDGGRCWRSRQWQAHMRSVGQGWRARVGQHLLLEELEALGLLLLLLLREPYPLLVVDVGRVPTLFGDCGEGGSVSQMYKFSHLDWGVREGLGELTESERHGGSPSGPVAECDE